MRYLIQYLLPALVLLSVVYLVTRGRYTTGDPSEGNRDQRMFLIIFCIGAALAALLGYLFYQYMSP